MKTVDVKQVLMLKIPVNSEGDVFEYDLDKEKITIGRRHDNDIRIKETYVSAYHAEMTRDPGGNIFLRDRDSSNGTFRNGKRLNSLVKLREGDILKFGSLKCLVVPARGLNGSSSWLAEGAAAMAEATKNNHAPPPLIKNKTTTVTTRADEVQARPLTKTSFIETKTSTTPLISGNPKQEALAREVETLKTQFERSQAELKKAKEELEKASLELAKAKKHSESEDRRSAKEIESLESNLIESETENNRLSQRLREAKTRAEKLESELEHHRTDMSAEIKAAMERLTYSKNDNVLLQRTLDSLEEERSKQRDRAQHLSDTLKRTREGFSFFLHNTSQKLEEATRLHSELKAEFDVSQSKVRLLEGELTQLRSDYSAMEADYRKRLKESKTARDDSRAMVKALQRDLDTANHRIKDQQAEIIRLETCLNSLQEEKSASDHDWSTRLLEMQSINRRLLGDCEDLDTLEEKIKESSESVENLRSEKTRLEAATQKLAKDKEKLLRETAKVFEERDASAETINRVKRESEDATSKLESILKKLKASEKKVAYLRSLETELEKSVLRAQRSALSRKSIYREDEEADSSIWPESEQEICRELIDRLELLEDMLKRYQQSWFFPKVADQLNLLRDSFLGLLKNHSVEQFQLEPGTELSVESRKKIQLISIDDLEDGKLKKAAQKIEDTHRTTVVQTLRPGYIFYKGGQDVIIRKAEVIVV